MRRARGGETGKYFIYLKSKPSKSVNLTFRKRAEMRGRSTEVNDNTSKPAPSVRKGKPARQVQHRTWSGLRAPGLSASPPAAGRGCTTWANKPRRRFARRGNKRRRKFVVVRRSRGQPALLQREWRDCKHLGVITSTIIVL